MSSNSEGDGYHPSKTQQGSCPHPEIIHEVDTVHFTEPILHIPSSQMSKIYSAVQGSSTDEEDSNEDGGHGEDEEDGDDGDRLPIAAAAR